MMLLISGHGNGRLKRYLPAGRVYVITVRAHAIARHAPKRKPLYRTLYNKPCVHLILYKIYRAL
jgi:hypothetical protein